LRAEGASSGERLRVGVDRAACRGAAVCVRRAPRTFSLDGARRAVAANPPGDPAEALRAAERHCPNFAIRVSPAPVRREESSSP